MTRIAISNLAWDVAETDEALALLSGLGVAGVEVAPTRIAGWDELSPMRLKAYARQVEGAGLAVSSLQAIYFDRPGCELLGDATAFAAMAEQMRRIAGIGAALTAKVAVFGAPGTRRRGERPAGEATEMALERMTRLGAIANDGGLVIGIEPVPTVYGGDFLLSAEEVRAFVAVVNHPAVRLHLDTGCVLLGGDDIGEAVRAGREWLAHFHAAEPQLAGFSEPQADHAGAGAALREIGYDAWVAIEMRQPAADSLGAIRTAVDVIRRHYGSTGRPDLPLERSAALSGIR